MWKKGTEMLPYPFLRTWASGGRMPAGAAGCPAHGEKSLPRPIVPGGPTVLKCEEAEMRG